MNAITLTADQQKAKDQFIKFILDPRQQTFVIAGFAGTGKTTLTGLLISELPKILRTAKLLGNEEIMWDVQLTATTNKAAEALSSLVGAPAITIQSFLGLRVQTNYQTKQTRLVPSRNCRDVTDTILFIDEASYIDNNLLTWITKLTHNCKVIFMGDPAQLTPVKSAVTPVFKRGFNTASLEEVVRQQAGNPIIDLATAFRNTVNTGQFFSFKPDGKHVIHMPRDQFEQTAFNDFSNPDWRSQDSKILAWTNKRVIAYNHAIRDLIKGNPKLEVGDYAVCNKYIRTARCNLRTDQLIQITNIKPDRVLDVDGCVVEMNKGHYAFFPNSLDDKNKALKKARAEERWEDVQLIIDAWIDLRAAYSCTINKSQGSTYDRVYVDLDDIKKCNSSNQIARMLYVAVSRARHQVFFTGDIV